jgi:hypothetical protein
MKKSLSILSLIILWITPLITSAQYAQDTEFTTALEWMHTQWLTKYDTADAFRPWDELTRQEFAWLLWRYLKKELIPYNSTCFLRNTFCSDEDCLQQDQEAEECKKIYEETSMENKEILKWLGINIAVPEDWTMCTFKDTEIFDTTLIQSISVLCEYWLMKWYDNNFHPNDIITKAELLTVLIRMQDWLLPENQIPRWSNYYTNAFNTWLTKESDTSKIELPVTRYEAALLLNRQYWAPILPWSSTDTKDVSSYVQEQEVKDTLRSSYLRTE